MFKIQILMTCIECNGQAYIFDRRAVANNGDAYDQYKPCPTCNGSGNQARWVALRSFIDLLERAYSTDQDSVFAEKE